MKNLLTKLKALAVAGLAMGLALGAQAEDAIKCVAPVYKGTDNNPANGIACWTTSSVPSGYAMNPAWVDGETGRTIVLDTRDRIVIAAPGEVLPIAYSTNFWATTEDWKTCDSVKVDVTDPSGEKTNVVSKTDVNGYAEWFPEEGAYGKYYLEHSVSGRITHNVGAEIYYSAYFPLSWSPAEHGTLAVTNEGVAISSPANVLGYTYLSLSATPALYRGTQERYEFAGWTAKTNSVAWTNIANAVATLEMPNAGVALAGGFQWKSNYTEQVTIAAGDEWEVFEGESYSGGFMNNGTLLLAGACQVDSAVRVSATGTNIWDFTAHREPCLTLNAELLNNGVQLILFDTALTNGVYTFLRQTGYSLSGATDFTISNGTSEKVCTPGSEDWVYVGAKRFKIANDAGVYTLTVDDGRFAITYDAMGGAFANGCETNAVDAYVNKGYEFPDAPARDNYTFTGWFRAWTNGAEKVTELDTAASPVSPLSAHTLWAQWTPVSVEPTDKVLSLPDVKEDGQPTLEIADKEYAQTLHPSQCFESFATPIYLRSIGDCAFQGVTTLQELVIVQPRDFANPSNFVDLVVGQQAFASCTSLEEVRIPAGVTQIGMAAFMNCAKLKRIVFTGSDALGYDLKAFYRCGYDNGAGELKVYMSQEFKANNAALLADFADWNTTIKITPMVGWSPAAGTPYVDFAEFGTLGSDRRVALLAKVPTQIPGTKPDPDAVIILHAASLDVPSWKEITPDSTTACEDGTLLIEFTMPEGDSGFIKVTLAD